MIDARFWPSGGNRIEDNVIAGSGRSDLALGGPAEQRSCFSGNDAVTTVPLTLTLLHSCDGINIPLWYGLATSSDALGRIAQVNNGQNTILEHGEAPEPELDFDQMPQETPRPAVDVFTSLGFDPAAIGTPPLPDGYEPAPRRPVVLGIAVDGGFWPVLMGALLWWVPLLAWAVGGVWALISIWRSERAAITRVIWSIIVVGIPAIGVVLYAAFGNRRRRLLPRLGVALGGTVAWLIAVVGALLVGGVF
jgi:hypothetical protein